VCQGIIGKCYVELYKGSTSFGRCLRRRLVSSRRKSPRRPMACGELKEGKAERGRVMRASTFHASPSPLVRPGQPFILRS